MFMPPVSATCESCIRYLSAVVITYSVYINKTWILVCLILKGICMSCLIVLLMHKLKNVNKFICPGGKKARKISKHLCLRQDRFYFIYCASTHPKPCVTTIYESKVLIYLCTQFSCMKDFLILLSYSFHI